MGSGHHILGDPAGGVVEGAAEPRDDLAVLDSYAYDGAFGRPVVVSAERSQAKEWTRQWTWTPS